MDKPANDTIFALSSGRGPSAVAVIRISGPMAEAALKAVSGRTRTPEARQAAFARIRHPQTGEPIDEALVLWFPGPRSETGEDVVELQLHGGRAVVASTLAALSAIDGLRPAEAGEFTRRAFENGKLDLTAVEGLADLVMAETETQRRQAYRQMKGALGARAEEWRRKLIDALALVEAGIDFSDEGDVPKNLAAPAQEVARGLAAEIAGALADSRRGERLREGMVVAIAGPPNAGKSTLLNRIARREAAIVSPYAGTTRDVIEVHLDLDGYPVTLLDTAGIRETDDPVEMEGVRRARERAAAADLVLWVVDASAPVPAGGAAARVPSAGVSPGGEQHAARAAASSGQTAEGDSGEAAEATVKTEELALTPSQAIWLVQNKIDLISGAAERSELGEQSKQRTEGLFQPNEQLTGMVNRSLNEKNESGYHTYEFKFRLSAVSGEGFGTLLAALAERAAKWLGGEPALVTRERHRIALERTKEALEHAASPELAERDDLIAEELRTAATSLGRLTGRVDVEDILDVIFRDFCVGK